MSTNDKAVEKSSLFDLEAVLRAHASVAQLLELDGILVNREIDEATRTTQAHSFIEKFVERVSHAG
jgi:hypothetical protein